MYANLKVKNTEYLERNIMHSYYRVGFSLSISLREVLSQQQCWGAMGPVRAGMEWNAPSAWGSPSGVKEFVMGTCVNSPERVFMKKKTAWFLSNWLWLFVFFSHMHSYRLPWNVHQSRADAYAKPSDLQNGERNKLFIYKVSLIYFIIGWYGFTEWDVTYFSLWLYWLIFKS